MKRPDGTTFRQYLTERRKLGGAGAGLKGQMQLMKDWRSGAPLPSQDGITKLPGGGTQTVVGSPSYTLMKMAGGS